MTAQATAGPRAEGPPSEKTVTAARPGRAP